MAGEALTQHLTSREEIIAWLESEEGEKWSYRQHYAGKGTYDMPAVAHSPGYFASLKAEVSIWCKPMHWYPEDYQGLHHGHGDRIADE